MNRNITGTIKKMDGTVWDGALLEFELERSSFDESAQYPNGVVRAVAGENGEISVSLWINEKALRPSRYICTLPDGSQFRFNLLEGSDAADLNELRETAVEDDSPTQSSMVAFLPVVRTEAQNVVDQAISGLETEIAAKADKSALNTTNTSVASLNIELESKAKQVSLDATDTNVGQLMEDLETLSHAVDDKASQTDLNAINANLAAANTTIASKASQSALSLAIADLQDAIVSGQIALQNLIDQKASLVHNHASEDIQGSVGNSIAYFDSAGELVGSDQLMFESGNIGLGTSAPENTLDLQHPNADGGNQSRMTVVLNSSGPELRLIADPVTPTSPVIALECGGVVNTIDSDIEGKLGLGLYGVTSGILFRTVNGSITFFGVKSGWEEPNMHYFDNDTFGFYRQTSMEFGDPLSDSLYLVIYTGDLFKALSLK